MAVVLGVLASSVAVFRLFASQPQLAGTLHGIKGVTSRVSLIRDPYGVPHVFATTEADAYFALGFAHGQDRFFQMDLTRRLVQGRLSELLGDATRGRDIEAREQGLDRIARANYEVCPPDVRAALEAYASGVNAALEHGWPAPEYTLLLSKPEPWRAEDSAAVAVAMTVNLVTGLQQELEELELRRYLSPAKLAEFLGGYPEWGLRSVEDDPGTANPGTLTGRGTFEEGAPHGSNAWIVGGSKTHSGKPILANDPHLPLSIPGPFYLVRVTVPRGSLVGATLPGAPVVVIGRNDHLAWANTANEVDGEDLSVAPSIGSPRVSVNRENLRIRSGLFSLNDEPLTVYTTPDGPILRREHWRNLPEDMVLRSAALDPSNGLLSALFRMQWATTIDSFMSASGPWTAPLTTMLVASVDGDIALFCTGNLPLRNDAGEWVGTIPRAAAPQAVNPDSDTLIAANNLVPSSSYAYPMPGYYDPYRIARIKEALVEGGSRDVAGAEALQRDARSIFARRVLATLRTRVAPRSPQASEWFERLERWDGGMAADRAEPLVFAAWMRELSRLVYADETDRIDRPIPEAGVGQRRVFLDAVLSGNLAKWCDVVGTTIVETCDELASSALERALVRLRKENASSSPAWRWGMSHYALFEHPLLSEFPLLSRYGRVEVPDGGDSSTVNAGGYFDDSGFTKLSGASLRVAFDLADLNRSHFQLAPGQSGNALSSHFRDLVDGWKDGHGFEIRTDWDVTSPPAHAQILILER